MTNSRTLDLRPYFSSPASQRRNEARRTNPDANECYLCRRQVTVSDKTVWVQVVDGGFWAADRTETGWVDETDPGYMGCFPVGSVCARRIPKRFLGE